jgi:hypothetical protein
LVVKLSRLEEIRRAKSLTDLLPITIDFYQQAKRFAERALLNPGGFFVQVELVRHKPDEPEPNEHKSLPTEFELLTGAARRIKTKKPFLWGVFPVGENLCFFAQICR